MALSGLAFALSLFSAWWAYSKSADRALWNISIGICIVLAANGLLLAVITLKIKGLFFTGPISTPVGTETCAPAQWPAWIFLQPFVRVSVEWLQPACGVELKKGAEYVKFARRLKGDSITRRIKLEDWLGVWSWQFEVNTKVEVTVHPALAPPAGKPPKLHNVKGEGDDSEGSGEGDLLEFRAYQEGDSANRIMWKLFSRTGKLYVRKPEKAGAPLIGIFLVCSDTDEPAAELAWYVTNPTIPMSQAFFGDNWVFGTSAESYEGDDAAELVHSAQPQAAGDRIMASGRTHGCPNSKDVKMALEAFIKRAGAGMGSVVVLLGEELEGAETWDIPGCHLLGISRSDRDTTLAWKHL